MAPSKTNRPQSRARSQRTRQGSALLAVMWMSAALAAIAFSLSSTVIGEGERASTELDGVRAYYLAVGGVERATVELLWSIDAAPNKRPIVEYATTVNYSFGPGDVRVDIMPESGKLSANAATAEELDRLLIALGADPAQAASIADGIVAWRQPATGAQPVESAVSLQPSSFQPVHASFQEIEELLLVQGVTPDLFYGSFVPAGGRNGSLEFRPGLIDCLSIFGTKDKVDVNTANPAVLEAVGLSPSVVQAIVAQRTASPFNESTINQIPADGAAGGRLRVGGNSIVTLRATARLRGADGKPGDLKRTVAAMVKYMPPGWDTSIHVLRWFDFAVGGN